MKLSEVASFEQVRVGWRTNTAPAWEFDCDAIAEAARSLGLEWPIEVGCAEYANGRWGGMHSCEPAAPAGWKHRVRVKRAATAAYASRVIWHELTHALQNERDGVHEHRAQRIEEDMLYPKGTPLYRQRPTEREAIANESLALARPLVRPA